ncbi:MAG: hypothetical protein R2686_02390 [Candidatus Nanopelagicales bacterium]
MRYAALGLARTGLRVQRRYQAATTPDGTLRVWLARQKGPGRPTEDETAATNVLRRPEAGGPR